MSDEKINETINNLKKYVEEDNFYSGEWSVESDFDAFCYNHCLDINRVLSYIEELEKYKRKHSIVKRHYVSKDTIKDKIEELEENINFTKTIDNFNGTKENQKYYVDGFSDCIILFKELLEGE